MKKVLLFVMVAVFLGGCAAEPVYETIGNAMEDTLPVGAPGTIELTLPEDAEMQVIDGESGSKSYRIGDMELWTQVCEGGDISDTLEQVTGIRSDALTVMEYQLDEMSCNEIAWITNTDEGSLVCRTAVLDDGNYHYCISLMMPEENAQELSTSFSEIMDGVSISGIGA